MRRRKRQRCRSNWDLSSRKCFRRRQKGGPRLLGNMARKHQNWHQWESKFENWKIEQWRYPYELKHKRWLRVGPKRDQKHLNCTRGAGNFDLCLLCPNWTKTSALWLLRLTYGCFDWILQCKILTPSYDAWNALEVHTASEIHTPLGIRENARSWLFDWSKPTDGATKLGQTPRTHCGVMASKRCEWCHSLRLISWVAWQ